MSLAHLPQLGNQQSVILKLNLSALHHFTSQRIGGPEAKSFSLHKLALVSLDNISKSPDFFLRACHFPASLSSAISLHSSCSPPSCRHPGSSICSASAALAHSTCNSTIRISALSSSSSAKSDWSGSLSTSQQSEQNGPRPVTVNR